MGKHSKDVPSGASRSRANPDRLAIVPFGRQLFETADLDPIYVALLGAKLPRPQLARWLIAYWCFYHAGAASWLSEWDEPHDFWLAMLRAAKNNVKTPCGSRWPRGAERRHFRGEAASSAVISLRKRYGDRPEEMLDFLTDGNMDVRAVIDRAMEHRLFGPWIAFKVADMVDAVWGVRVVQDDASTFLYDTPRKSILENFANGVIPAKPGPSEQSTLIRGMVWLQGMLGDCRIPHRRKEAPDWFSLETVWCKHLSHMHGFYPPGKDIREIRHGLEPWIKHSETARRFLKNMPEIVLDGTLF